MTIGLIPNIAILLGSVFCLISTIGIYRFDKTLYQIHASSKGLTLGAMLVMAGAFLSEPYWAFRMRVILILLFFFVTNPLSGYAIGRAWYQGYTGKKNIIDPE